MIEARDVTVRVGGRALIERVSLTVRPGEMLAVVGPNGAGKSTLLRALTGELAPSSGDVLLSGRALASWPRRELARVRAVLPQETTLAFALTAYEVVMLGRLPHIGHREGPRDHARVRASLEHAGVLHLAERAYPTLSGGERRRVQFARALAQLPDAREASDRYLLLDEPTANLDLAHERATLATARAAAREGAGVLAVLHDLNLASEVADRIALLADGQLVSLGAPEVVLTPARVRATFGVDVERVAHPRTGRAVLLATSIPLIPSPDGDSI